MKDSNYFFVSNKPSLLQHRERKPFNTTQPVHDIIKKKQVNNCLRYHEEFS